MKAAITYKRFEQDLKDNPAMFQEYNREQVNVLNRLKSQVNLSRIWLNSAQRNKEFAYFIQYWFGKEFRYEYYRSYFVWRTCPNAERLIQKSINYFIM